MALLLHPEAPNPHTLEKITSSKATIKSIAYIKETRAKSHRATYMAHKAAANLSLGTSISNYSWAFTGTLSEKTL